MAKSRRLVETRSAAEIFAVNERANQMLLAGLDPAAWRAKPAGGVRTIAAIVTHVHNVRAKWVRLNAPQVGVPAQLKWASCRGMRRGWDWRRVLRGVRRCWLWW